MNLSIQGEHTPTPTVTAQLADASTTLTFDTETNSQTYTVDTPAGRISLTVGTSQTQASVGISIDGIDYFDTELPVLKKAFQVMGDVCKLSAIIAPALASE